MNRIYSATILKENIASLLHEAGYIEGGMTNLSRSKKRMEANKSSLTTLVPYVRAVHASMMAL